MIGCQLCMGHAVDQNLFSLVQHDVRQLIERLTNIETKQFPSQGSNIQQHLSGTGIQESIDALQTRLQEHSERLDAVIQQQEMQPEEIRMAKESLREENKNILERLVAIEELLSEKLLLCFQGMEQNLAETGEKVKELEQQSVQMKKDIRGLYNKPGNSFFMALLTIHGVNVVKIGIHVALKCLHIKPPSFCCILISFDWTLLKWIASSPISLQVRIASPVVDKRVAWLFCQFVI